MSNDDRRSYPIKLKPVEDGDLIAWLDNLPDGQRLDIMKAALRAYMPDHDRAPDLAVVASDVSWIKDALEALPGWLDSKLAGLSVAPVQDAATTIEDAPRLSDQEVSRVKANMLKNKW